MRSGTDVKVGGIWKKCNERGTQWLAMRLNVEEILTLAGGDVGLVNLVAFSRPKTADNQPDYDVLWAKTQPTQELPARPNTPGVRDVDYGEIAGTASYRRRPRDDR